jgi:hypothetical protein
MMRHSLRTPAQGKAWQFKDFPFKGANKGDLMETFDAVFGAYFHYSDEKA